MQKHWIWLAAALAAMPASAADYLVLLKDGSVIEAREPLRTEGRRAYVRRKDGVLVSLPANFVDTEKTRRANSGEVEVVLRSRDSLEAGEDTRALEVLATGKEAMPRKVDNFSLMEFRRARIAQSPGGEEAGGPEDAAAAKGAEMSKAGIMASELKLQDQVNALNDKIRQLQDARNNYPLQQKLQREVEEMQRQYNKDYDAYSKMVDEYNRSVQAPRPVSGEEAGAAVEEEGAEAEAAEEEAVTEEESAEEGETQLVPEEVEEYPEEAVEVPEETEREE
jgi:hypothetical protein